MPQSTVIARLGCPLKVTVSCEGAREEVRAFVNPFDDGVPTPVRINVAQDDRHSDQYGDQRRDSHHEAREHDCTRSERPGRRCPRAPPRRAFPTGRGPSPYP